MIKIMTKEEAQAKLRNRDFTIISQDCIGGLMYHKLNLEFASPTINLAVYGEDFVKLVKNPRFYFELEPYVLQEDYRFVPNSQAFPLLQVGDIKLYCLHYDTGAEAIAAWKRRSKRVNYDNIFIVSNEWDLQDSELIGRVLEAPSRGTVIFTWNKYEDSRCVPLDHSRFSIPEGFRIPRPDITDPIPPRNEDRYYETVLDYVNWLNGAERKEP